jgi:hypothetical protein
MTLSPQDILPATTVDHDSWLGLAQAQNAEQLCGAWLMVLCQSLVSARAGMVLLLQSDGSYAPVATTPDGRDLRYLSDIATDVLRQREGIVLNDELGHARIAYPLQSSERKPDAKATDGRLYGAVVLDLGQADDDALERALRLTHWGAGWLLDALNQRELAGRHQHAAEGGKLLDTLLALLAERSLRPWSIGLAANSIVSKCSWVWQREWERVTATACGCWRCRMRRGSTSAMMR